MPSLLQRCLNSIPIRDDLQVIVVDDHSDDQIVDFNNFPEWKGKNYISIFSKKDIYAGVARNIGFSYAKGKWITYLDADDLLTDAANTIFDKYIDNKADIIRLGLERRDCDSLKLLSDDNWYMQKLSDTRLSDLEKMLNCSIGAAQFIKKDFIKTCQISWGEEKHHNDTMFSTQLAVYCQKLVISTSDVFYVWTAREGSISSTINKNAIIQHFKTDKAKFNFVKKKGIPLSNLGNYQMEHLQSIKQLTLIQQLPILFQMLISGMLFNVSKEQPLKKKQIIKIIGRTIKSGIKNQLGI